MFVQLNFTRVGSMKFCTSYEGESSKTVSCSETFGMSPDPAQVLALDVASLIDLLSLPRQMRGVNPSEARLARMYSQSSLATAAMKTQHEDRYDLDRIMVAKARFSARARSSQHHMFLCLTQRARPALAQKSCGSPSSKHNTRYVRERPLTLA